MVKHLFQSEIWFEFQKALEKEVIFNDDYLAIQEKGKFNKRLYLPYGYITKTKSKQLIKNFPSIDSIRVEPIDIEAQELKKQGFKKAIENIQPSATAILDLNVNDEEIINRAKKDKRKIYRQCIRKGVTFEESYNIENISIFLKLYKSVQERNNFENHSDKYFRTLAKTLFPNKNAGLQFAIFEDQIIAVQLFIVYDKTIYCIYAGTNPDFKTLSPGTALLFETQFLGKRLGCRELDLFGLSSTKDPLTKDWDGFSKYKLDFGAIRKEYIGTWELPVKKTRYFLFRIVLRLVKRR